MIKEEDWSAAVTWTDGKFAHVVKLHGYSRREMLVDSAAPRAMDFASPEIAVTFEMIYRGAVVRMKNAKAGYSYRHLFEGPTRFDAVRFTPMLDYAYPSPTASWTTYTRLPFDVADNAFSLHIDSRAPVHRASDREGACRYCRGPVSSLKTGEPMCVACGEKQ